MCRVRGREAVLPEFPLASADSISLLDLPGWLHMCLAYTGREDEEGGKMGAGNGVGEWGIS